VPIQEWSTHLILRDHQYPVGCLAWSLEDSILLTSAEQHIKLWNAQVSSFLHHASDFMIADCGGSLINRRGCVSKP
jgi:hypothetical protein